MTTFRWIILIACLVVIYVAAEVLLHRRVVPPPTVDSFATMVEWRMPRSIEVIEEGDSEYLLATGWGSGVLPSGPSAYVFDRSGKLVDWSGDMGDDPQFYGKWIRTSKRETRQLDLVAAFEWIDSEVTTDRDHASD
jgi:hypothetical protein